MDSLYRELVSPLRKSRAGEVYDLLKDEILRAKIEPSEVLIETELAERFNCSKTPVREALQTLVWEGLVSVIPRKGYMVQPLTLRDVVDQMEVRLALETSIAATAATRATPEDIVELNKLLDIQRAATDTKELADAARTFHLKIVAMAHNRRALKILLPLYDETTRIHHLVPMSSRHLHSDREITDHERLIEAIENNDSEAAKEAMRDHILSVQQTTMNGLLHP